MFSQLARREARAGTYASGNLGKNILWGSADIILLFAMTDLAGLDPAVAGAILLSSLVLDAVIDPAIGALADRIQTPLGRYGAFLLPGAFLAGASFVAMVHLASQPGGSAVAIAAGIFIFRAAYSLIDLPHNALMANAFTASRTRARLAGYRFFFSSCAALVFAFWLGPIVTAPADEASTQLRTFSVFAALLSTAVMITSWSVVRREDRRAVRTHSDKRKTGGMATLASNGQFQVILVLSVLTGLGPPMFGKSLAYFSAYVLDMPPLSALALSAMTLGQLASLPFWIGLGHRLEKAHLLTAAYLIVGGAFLLAAYLAPVLPVSFVVFAFLGGCGLSGVYSIIWAMLPDAVDWVEHRTGTRPEGAAYGAVIFIMKASNAIGIGALGFALSVSDYIPGEAQSASVRLTIQFFAGFIPFAGALIAWAALRRYRLTHAVHARIAPEAKPAAE